MGVKKKKKIERRNKYKEMSSSCKNKKIAKKR